MENNNAGLSNIARNKNKYASQHEIDISSYIAKDFNAVAVRGSVSGIETDNQSGASSRIGSSSDRRNDAVMARYKLYFDTNKDGAVSDEESLAYILKLKRSRSEKGLEYLMQLNENAEAIKNYYESVDTDGEVGISTYELIKESLNPNSINVDPEIRDLVLGASRYRHRIEELVKNADIDGDKSISEFEALTSIMSQRSGDIEAKDMQIVDAIIEQFSDHRDLKSRVNVVDTDSNGEVSRDEIYAILRAAKKGEIDPEAMPGLMTVISFNPDYEQIIKDFERDYPDIDGDGIISPRDVLIIINYINTHGAGLEPGQENWDYRKDANKDGVIDSRDSQHVINFLNNAIAGM